MASSRFNLPDDLVTNECSTATVFKHRARCLAGRLVILTDIEVNGPLSVSICVPDYLQVGVMLEQVGGVCEPRSKPGKRRDSRARPHEINIVPPGIRTWSESDLISRCRSICLLFDPESLGNKTTSDTRYRPPDRALLGVPNEPIARLAQLLALKFDEEDELGDLYGDSLVVAMSVLLERTFSSGHPSSASKLSVEELTRVLTHIEEHAASTIRLQDLVGLTTMSQSAFYAAFKAATGLPPHRYQLNVRVKRAQIEMLATPQLPLSQLAARLGFADQPHFTRVFRRFTGLTPRAWLASALR